MAVVFGGRSPEHAISCISAGSVLAVIDRDRFDVVPIGITRAGRWVLAADDPAALAARGKELPAVAETGTALALPGDPTAGGLVPLDGAAGLTAAIDVVFPVLHGPYGEDGTIQGLLELAEIPYVGAGVLASAVCMDKAVMKAQLSAAGLPMPAWEVVRDREWRADRGAVLERVARLGPCMFVKPARGGSSIGISRVEQPEQLERAIEVAREHDPKVLVEAAVTGREVECGVLDGLAGGPPEASVPAEIRVTGGQAFYDFEAKYLDPAEFDIPPDLPSDTVAAVRAMAVATFTALECEGLARVDFFVEAGGRLLVNEVNTMPGFTPASMFPLMWAAAGLDYPALVDRLLCSALERGTGLR